MDPIATQSSKIASPYVTFSASDVSVQSTSNNLNGMNAVTEVPYDALLIFQSTQQCLIQILEDLLKDDDGEANKEALLLTNERKLADSTNMYASKSVRTILYHCDRIVEAKLFTDLLPYVHLFKQCLTNYNLPSNYDSVLRTYYRSQLEILCTYSHLDDEDDKNIFKGEKLLKFGKFQPVAPCKLFDAHCKTLPYPSVLLCTAEIETIERKNCLLSLLKILKNIASTWASKQNSYFYHSCQILRVENLQSISLKNYRSIFGELHESVCFWRMRDVVNVLLDLDCLRKSHDESFEPSTDEQIWQHLSQDLLRHSEEALVEEVEKEEPKSPAVTLESTQEEMNLVEPSEEARAIKENSTYAVHAHNASKSVLKRLNKAKDAEKSHVTEYYYKKAINLPRVTGVFFGKSCLSWVAQIPVRKGHTKQLYFSVKKYGFTDARLKAIEARGVYTASINGNRCSDGPISSRANLKRVLSDDAPIDASSAILGHNVSPRCITRHCMDDSHEVAGSFQMKAQVDENGNAVYANKNGVGISYAADTIIDNEALTSQADYSMGYNQPKHCGSTSNSHLIKTLKPLDSCLSTEALGSDSSITLPYSATDNNENAATPTTSFHAICDTRTKRWNKSSNTASTDSNSLPDCGMDCSLSDTSVACGTTSVTVDTINSCVARATLSSVTSSTHPSTTLNYPYFLNNANIISKEPSFASQARASPQVPGVSYDSKRACWMVRELHASSLSHKQFHVRKFGGFEQARAVAIQYLNKIRNTEGLQPIPEAEKLPTTNRSKYNPASYNFFVRKEPKVCRKESLKVVKCEGEENEVCANLEGEHSEFIDISPVESSSHTLSSMNMENFYSMRGRKLAMKQRNCRFSRRPMHSFKYPASDFSRLRKSKIAPVVQLNMNERPQRTHRKAVKYTFSDTEDSADEENYCLDTSVASQSVETPCKMASPLPAVNAACLTSLAAISDASSVGVAHEGIKGIRGRTTNCHKMASSYSEKPGAAYCKVKSKKADISDSTRFPNSGDVRNGSHLCASKPVKKQMFSLHNSASKNATDTSFLAFDKKKSLDSAEERKRSSGQKGKTTDAIARKASISKNCRRPIKRPYIKILRNLSPIYNKIRAYNTSHKWLISHANRHPHMVMRKIEGRPPITRLLAFRPKKCAAGGSMQNELPDKSPEEVMKRKICRKVGKAALSGCHNTKNKAFPDTDNTKDRNSSSVLRVKNHFNESRKMGSLGNNVMLTEFELMTNGSKEAETEEEVFTWSEEEH